MKPVRLLTLLSLLFFMNACVPAMPGAKSKNLTINDVAPGLAGAASLNPFKTEANPTGAEVSYKVFGIAQVDEFTLATAKLLGAIMVAEKMKEVATNFGEGLSLGSYSDATKLGAGALEFAQRVVSEATGLQEKGQALVGGIADIAASKPLLIPAITTELTECLGRLGDALTRAKGLVGG